MVMMGWIQEKQLEAYNTTPSSSWMGMLGAASMMGDKINMR
jgi:hypothetical protein